MFLRIVLKFEFGSGGKNVAEWQRLMLLSLTFQLSQ